MEKETIRKILLGIALGLLIVSMFFIGAYTACNSGEGKLNKFKCVNVEIIGTCEDIKGNLYVVPNNIENAINI